MSIPLQAARYNGLKAQEMYRGDAYNMEPLTPEDQELVAQIKRKVDRDAVSSTQEQSGCEPYIYPPASLEEIQWAEEGIGAKLPPLIRELYLQVGNGGFGPGLGITGLITG